MERAAGDTSSARMQALAATATVLAVRDAAQAVARNPGAAGGVTFSASVGSSRSESTYSASSEEAVASRVIAGKDLRVRATGGASAAGPANAAGATDADGTVLLRGVQVRAGARVEIDAARDIRIEAARSTSRQQGTEHSSSASVGVSMGTGSPGGAPPQAGVTVAVSGSRGRANGEETRWTLSHIEAGQQVQLSSRRDTVLSGAVVSAPHVVVDAGRQLLVESLQDTSRYNSDRAQASANATFGPGPSAGVGLGGSRIDSQYASVTEQAGIRAGDGGFQIRAQGGTELRGGAITSTDAAVAAGLNRLDTPQIRLSDIDNRASYRAEAGSVNIGAASSADGQTRPAGTGAGFGSDSGHAASVTRSAVSGIAGDTGARTGDAQTGISPLFDAGRVQREVDAQVAITQRIGEQAPRLVAEVADGRAQALRGEAQRESDPSRQRALLEQAANWEEGGAARVAAHAVVGAVTGGVAGAAGAGVVAAAAPALDALQSRVTAALADAGSSEGVARGTGQVVANVAALVLGGVASGGSAAGAALALDVDANNRQLHPTEIQWIKDNARRFANRMGISEAEAERRLGTQAYRIVQVGVAGDLDATAAAFLREGGRQLFPAHPATAALGPGYIFQATADQRTNTLMYQGAVASNPIARRFYTDNQLQIPNGPQLSDGAARDGNARAVVARWTANAAITAAGLVLSPALAGAPAEIAEFLRNPVVYCAIRPSVCMVAVDTAATTAAGVPVSGVTVPTLPRVTSAAAEVATHPQTAEEVATVVRVRPTAATVAQAQIVALDAASRRTAEVQEAVFANLPRGIDQRGAVHILWGDKRDSGGHLWPGNPHKTPFPQDWQERRILDTASEIFVDPKTPWRLSPDGRVWLVEVQRDGVEVRVVVDRSRQRVVSAFPTNLPRNPK
jgi:filamentous hemagglutinin